MSEKILTYKYQIIKRTDLISSLTNAYSKEKFPLKKALGAIGGAVTQGYIAYNKKSDTYMRLR